MYPLRLPAHIDRYFGRFALIVSISFILGTVLPGMVAARNGVFYESDIRQRIIARNIQPAAGIEIQKDQIQNALVLVKQQLISTSISGDIKELVNENESRKILEEQWAQINSKDIPGPYFLNDLMFAWSAIYTSLGCMFFILLPKAKVEAPILSWRVTAFTGIFYVLYEGPVWMRNFVLSNEGRRVFSFANRDVCAPCFWMQELNSVIMFLLFALIWQKWVSIYKETLADLRKNASAPLDMKTLSGLSSIFLHWQAFSVVQTLGFIVFTEVFWGLVIINKDNRYLLPAIVFHVLWGISWLLASLPLFLTWQDFNRKKMQLLLGITSPNSEETMLTTDRETITQLSPISLLNGFGSVATAAISFAFPIIHSLLK